MAKQRRVAEIGHDGVWMQPLIQWCLAAGARMCWARMNVGFGCSDGPHGGNGVCDVVVGVALVEWAPAAQVRTVVPAPAMPK